MEMTTYSIEEAKDLRSKTNELNKALGNTTIALAGYLWKIKNGVVRTNTGATPLVNHWGFDSFEVFAEMPVSEGGLDMHHGRARNLAFMYEQLFVRVELDKGVLPTSSTKLIELAKIAASAKGSVAIVKRWAGKARELDCCEFQEAVANELGTGIKFKAIRFSLKPSQMTKFNKSLALARDRLGGSAGNSKGETMMRVLEDWLSMQTDTVRKKSAG